MDTYEGDKQNPTTLHKYFYCQTDPVNNSDPSGQDLASSMGILGTLQAFSFSSFRPFQSKSKALQYFEVPDGWSDELIWLKLGNMWGSGTGGTLVLSETAVWKIAHRGQYMAVRRERKGQMEQEARISPSPHPITRSEHDIGGYAEAWYLGSHHSFMTMTRLSSRVYRVTLIIKDTWDFDEHDSLRWPADFDTFLDDTKTVGTWAWGIGVKFPFYFNAPAAINVKGAVTFDEDW